ncbi:hypothetical protein RHMOL_Rhmol06G0195400 [Rhododendron molle]|uniref:Uncharacterized protein n=1 Tax=Rhododendron molle TaxID=49168 RepID=A0ACC0NG07_RHOML|nr:hypothetical protein RHMOL_Rhmol06G0195400 [Rhododendron molle]
MNDSRLLVAEMRSESSDAQSDDLKVRSTVLCTSFYSTNLKSVFWNVPKCHWAIKMGWRVKKKMTLIPSVCSFCFTV